MEGKGSPDGSLASAHGSTELDFRSSVSPSGPGSNDSPSAAVISGTSSPFDGVGVGVKEPSKGGAANEGVEISTDPADVTCPKDAVPFSPGVGRGGLSTIVSRANSGDSSKASPVAVPAGHPPAEPGEEFQCPFMLIKAAMDMQDAAAAGLPAPELPTVNKKQSSKGDFDTTLIRLPSIRDELIGMGLPAGTGDEGSGTDLSKGGDSGKNGASDGEPDSIRVWRLQSMDDSIPRSFMSFSGDTVGKSFSGDTVGNSNPTDDPASGGEGNQPVEPAQTWEGNQPVEPAQTFSTRNGSSKKGSSVKGESRSKDKKSKEKSGSKKSGSSKERRGSSSRKEKKETDPDKLKEEEMQRQLAELSCPMAGFRARNSNQSDGTGGTMSMSSGQSSRTAGSLSKFDNSARGSHSRTRKSGMMSHEHGTPSRIISAQSGTMRSGKTNMRVRRVHKLGQFSVYEASSYEPLIRKSWTQMCEMHTRSELGAAFYQKFFDDNTALHSMFVRTPEVMGAKFADILQDIVSAVEDVSLMKSKLKALSPMHLRVGVKTEHAIRMGHALFATFEDVLGPEQWTSEVRAAWEWLWSWLSQLLHQSLEDARNEATILSYSWDLALDCKSEEEMGELLFDTLFELAPNLKPVYRKPRQILSAKFVEMMSALVSFHGDPMMMDEQITWLGFRHIKYGAKKQHVRVMGDVLIETMSRAVGEDWTQDMAEAWQELWLHCCGLMMSVIDEASAHGKVVQLLWASVTGKTTEMVFGSTLRKMLLSGTEWVSSLSHGILENLSPSPVTARNQGTFEMGGIEGMRDVGAGVQGKAEKGRGDRGIKKSRTSSDMLQEGLGFQGIFDDPSKGGNSTESDAIGRHFWMMLTDLLDLLWEPEKQNQRLVVTTSMLFTWGIKTDHLETIGTALFASMNKLLGGALPPGSQEAWTWWWDITSKAMAKTLTVCEKNHSQVIRSSWELCKTLKSPTELGEVWFKELARMAPHVLHLFKRPKKIQAAQFMAVVDMLLTFIEEPAIFFDGFKALTIRHIKYGVKAEYAKAFGRSILIGIERTLEEKWDAKVGEAWTMLWVRASSHVARALQVGTNPVIVSLVQGDLEKLCDAMDCASRGERFEWLTQVDVNGEILSPLYWALRDGNFSIASYIMNDLLMLRADREAYYYGREVMFERHPDIVLQLCRDSPRLVCDTLFEGLMWHSKDVENGRIRVNYYIKELFSDPSKEDNVWKQALCILTEHGTPELFIHPVAKKVLEVKWDQFGLRCFATIQAIHLFLLTLFMIGSIEYHHDCRFKGLRFGVGGLALMCAGGQTWLAYRHWQLGWFCVTSVFGPDIPIPRYLCDFWNFCRFLSTWLLAIVSFMETCEAHAPLYSPGAHGAPMIRNVAVVDADIRLTVGSFAYGVMIVNSFLGILLWVQLLQALVLSERLSSFTFKLGYMLQDIARNLIVVSFLCLGFAAALTCLDEEHFERFGESITVLTRVILNVQPPHLDMGGLALFFVCCFTITVTLGMLNILIGQLWATYARLSNNIKGFAMQRRAEICCHMESLLPVAHRQKLFDSMEFEKPVPFNLGDSGPSGGLQVFELAKIRNESYYRPDRVFRYTGEADSNDPWPSICRCKEELQVYNDEQPGYAPV